MLLPHGTFLGKRIHGAELSGLRWNTSRYGPNEELAPHSHETANFCLLVRGGFLDKRPHADVSVGSGAAVFWAAGVLHAQRFLQHGGTCFNLAYPTSWLREYNVRFDDGVHHLDVRPDISALCRAIYSECSHRDEFSTLAIEGLSLQLLAQFARGTRASMSAPEPRWLHRAIELIHERLDRRLTLVGLACELDVEAPHLARAFQHAHGTSVVAFIQRTRIERACAALLLTDDSLTTIAGRLGFFDQSHFNRIFVKMRGVTPGAYRTNHRLSQKVQ